VAKVFDIDDRAGAYEPVVVKFRGEEYALGQSAATLLGFSAIYQAHPAEENEPEVLYALRLLRPMIGSLSPAIASVMAERDLTCEEELAFLPVLTEVMNRVGGISFREGSDE
jgi:hypothetical protein